MVDIKIGLDYDDKIKTKGRLRNGNEFMAKLA